MVSLSNSTFIDQDLEEKKKTFKDFKEYEKFFEKKGIIIDQNKRLKIINKCFKKILNQRKLKINENPKLLEEVVNLVDSPNISLCTFDKKYLRGLVSIPYYVTFKNVKTDGNFFDIISN